MLLCRTLKSRLSHLPKHPSKRIRRYLGSTPDTEDKTKFPHFTPRCIRNFSIIAHVDHGKSTLADRLIEIGCGVTGAAQQLDSLQVERERGITVKAQSAALRYTHNGVEYLLNLIDTPGHVDFSHEVKRSLFISDGAILLVDATQGVEAQTVSNFYTAFESDIGVIGAVNKIDMPAARSEAVIRQMGELFDIELDHIVPISAKTGLNTEKLFPMIIDLLPPPKVETDAPFQALLHDCQVHNAREMMITAFIKSGVVSPRDMIYFIQSGVEYEVKEVGVFLPNPTPTESLSAGQLGYLLINLKDISKVLIGDTICSPDNIQPQLLSCDKTKPVIFAGFYPDDEGDFISLSSAIDKLTRSDTSVSLKPDSNYTLGKGWMLGFLGTLHMDVFSQRLEQDFSTGVIATSPSITYRAVMKDGTVKEFLDPMEMPKEHRVLYYEEPMVLATLVVPFSCLSDVIAMCVERRGDQKELIDLNFDRCMLKYEMPFVETMVDFYSDLKRVSSGYASCDFEECGYQPTSITKVDITLNKNIVEGLSSIVQTDKARDFGAAKANALAKTIPRQMFLIAIQAMAGSKVVGRANVKPFAKDVTSKLYGGDQSRKRKVLERQKEGKKRMRTVGNIPIPKEAFRVMINTVKRKK